MKITGNLILRVILSIILLFHVIPGLFNGGINAFGTMFLNQVGFSPLGVPIAWAVKLSHIASAVAFLANRCIKPASIITIFVMVMGIVLVHYKEGWYVVGAGRNGIEFNLLLIAVCIALIIDDKKRTVA